MINYINIDKSFSVPVTLEDGVIIEKSGNVKRNSKVFFIKDAKRKATHYVKEQKAKQKYFEKYHFKVLKPPSYGVSSVAVS